MAKTLDFSVWIAIDKKTLKPVAVKEFMEDLPFSGNWLIECEIDLREVCDGKEKEVK